MKPTSLIGLAGVTAVTVIAAAITVHTSRAGDTQAERGLPLVPELVGKANAISSISVRDGELKIEIKKDGERFVDSIAGYPVRTEAVRNLVSSLAVLDIEERKTAKPERFADLELADAGAQEGAGRQLTLKAGDNAVADLVLGKRDLTLGGTRGGLFARHSGKPPAYLVRGDVTIPASRAGWFDTQLIKLGVQEIVSATMTPASGDPVMLVKSKSSGALILDNLPDGEAADPSKVQRYGQLASNLTFEDVRKASGEAAGQVSLNATTDKVNITIIPVAAELNTDEAWVRISVKPQAVSATADANKLNDKVKGYDFKLKKYDAEPLAWQLTDVLNKKDAKPAAPPMPQGMRGMPPGLGQGMLMPGQQPR